MNNSHFPDIHNDCFGFDVFISIERLAFYSSFKHFSNCCLLTGISLIPVLDCTYGTILGKYCITSCIKRKFWLFLCSDLVYCLPTVI